MKRETDYGYPIKSMYTPKDIEGLQYERDLGDPGSYPYTRGYYLEVPSPAVILRVHTRLRYPSG